MNVKRGKRRLLIGVPVLSMFLAFFGGVRLWAMYETAGTVWAAGVLLSFIILLTWFLIRTLGWIIEGFDLWDNKWISMRQIEENREWVMIALYEDDPVVRREKLQAVAEGRDPNNYESLRRDDWWHWYFGDMAFLQGDSGRLKWWAAHRLDTLVFSLVTSGMCVIAGLAVLILGPPPEYTTHVYLSILGTFGISVVGGLVTLFIR